MRGTTQFSVGQLKTIFMVAVLFKRCRRRRHHSLSLGMYAIKCQHRRHISPIHSQAKSTHAQPPKETKTHDKLRFFSSFRSLSFSVSRSLTVQRSFECFNFDSELIAHKSNPRSLLFFPTLFARVASAKRRKNRSADPQPLFYTFGRSCRCNFFPIKTFFYQ